MKNTKPELNSAIVGQNPIIRPSPSKSFWNLNNNNDGIVGFLKNDPIQGELTCKTCSYQCYGIKKMMKHIETQHCDLVPTNAESSSRTPEPETKKRKSGELLFKSKNENARKFEIRNLKFRRSEIISQKHF